VHAGRWIATAQVEKDKEMVIRKKERQQQPAWRLLFSVRKRRQDANIGQAAVSFYGKLSEVQPFD